MSRSTTPPPSSARGRPRLRDWLRVPSSLRRRWRSLTPSVRSPSPLPAQSAPSAASLTAPEATSPSETGSSIAPPTVSHAISTIVPTDSAAPTIAVQDEPIEDSKTKRWNAAMAECQRRMGVDFLGPETANFRSEKDVMNYIAGRETMEPDSEGKGRWQKLQRGLVPLARVSKIFCDPIADTISKASVRYSQRPSYNTNSAHDSCSLPARSSSRPWGSSSAYVCSPYLLGLAVNNSSRPQASIATHEEFEHITDALEEIKVHLQVIEMVAGHQGQLLGDTSVALLVHIIIVLSVVAQLRREKYGGRFLKAVVEIKPLSDALKDLKQISSRHQEAIIAGTLEVVMNIQASDEIERIRKWLNFDTVDSSPRMSSLLNDRAKGTGLWFFENRAFVDFIEGHTKMLSIQGKAGCGKSTVIASAIRHLRAVCASRGSGQLVLAHFFDAANISRRRDLDSVLSSFLCQLALSDQNSTDILAKARQQSISNGCFTHHEKLDALVRMLNGRLQGFLVIDALDEALEHEHARVLGALRRLRSCTNISVLVSSRVPLADEDLQPAVVSIDRVENNSDIRTALDIEFSYGGRLAAIANAEIVRNKLMLRAEGNIRWTTLVVKQLQSYADAPHKLEKLLEDLPPTLHGLYAECLEAVPSGDIADVRRLFAWI
ncbi:hypothetical protein FB107DRAFT_224456, partial [Schizophyllum commune]